jgi:lysophospholipase L1-like esterase
MLGVLAPLAFRNPSIDARWAGVLAAPWLVGALLLWGPTSARVDRAVALLLSSPLGRAAVILAAILLALLALLLTPAGGVTAALYGGVAAMALGARAGGESLRRGFISLALGGALTALLLGGLEAILRRDPLAYRLGVPTELAKWRGRYDGQEARNVFGFRSAHETVARRPGVSRVITLGDSFTWGDALARTEEVWPAQLERAWNAPTPGNSLEVINMGRSGYTTVNESELLRRLGWQFDPDLVIIQFLVNDAQPSGPNFYWEGTRERLTLIPPRFIRGGIGSSALWSLTLKGLRSALERRPRYEIYLEDFHDGRKGWIQMQGALAELGTASRTRGRPILFVLFPLFTPGIQTESSYVFADVHRRVAAAAANAGLEVLDLTPAFVAAGGDWLRWWATPYDAHPSAEGHRLAAETIAAFIRERGLLVARP